MTNGFALNYDKSLQIYFFCLKRQAKNNFLKDVKSTVGRCAQRLLVSDSKKAKKHKEEGFKSMIVKYKTW